MLLNKYHRGQLLKTNGIHATVKYLGEDLESGHALIEVVECETTADGHSFAPGLVAKMPHELLRAYILN